MKTIKLVSGPRLVLSKTSKPRCLSILFPTQTVLKLFNFPTASDPTRNSKNPRGTRPTTNREPRQIPVSFPILPPRTPSLPFSFDYPHLSFSLETNSTPTFTRKRSTLPCTQSPFSVAGAPPSNQVPHFSHLSIPSAFVSYENVNLELYLGFVISLLNSYSFIEELS